VEKASLHAEGEGRRSEEGLVHRRGDDREYDRSLYEKSKPTKYKEHYREKDRDRGARGHEDRDWQERDREDRDWLEEKEFRKRGQRRDDYFKDAEGRHPPMSKTREEMRRVRAKNEKGFEVYSENLSSIVTVPIESKNLKEWLVEGFKRGNIECPICFDAIQSQVRIWSCEQCFQPFHLKCLNKWVRTGPSKAIEFKCPKCVKDYKLNSFPAYYCFCGRVHEPEFSHYGIPHSCG
jgi:hypothetical protein